jgi:hypothetical protein
VQAHEQNTIRRKYLEATLTAYLVFKLKDTSMPLPEESNKEQKRFSEVCEWAELKRSKAEVSLVLADLARELVYHDYEGDGMPTEESIKGAMKALYIMPEDMEYLQQKLRVILPAFKVPG